MYVFLLSITPVFPTYFPFIQACDINPDCFNYLDVQDFKHPLILTFYDRYAQ